MVGQPLRQRIFPEQSYQGTASHTVSTGESKQKTVFNCKQGNTGYIYNIKRNTGIQSNFQVFHDLCEPCKKVITVFIRRLLDFHAVFSMRRLFKGGVYLLNH